MPKAPRAARVQRSNGRSPTMPLPAVTAAAAAVSAASGGTLAVSADARWYSLVVLLASGGISIMLALISALGAQATDLLWTIMYWRMTKTLIREGIQQIGDTLTCTISWPTSAIP